MIMKTYTFTLPEDINAAMPTPRTVKEFKEMERYYETFLRKNCNDTPDTHDAEIETIIERINPNRVKFTFGTNRQIDNALYRWVKRTISDFFRTTMRDFCESCYPISILNVTAVRNNIIIRNDHEVIPAGTEIVTNVDISAIFEEAARRARRAIATDARYKCERINEVLKELVIE
jgi:hypothetical protein